MVSSHTEPPGPFSGLSLPQRATPTTPITQPTSVHSHIGPAIQGIVFHKHLQSDDEQQILVSAGPVLSVVWLPLKAGFDVHDDSQAASHLWQAALEFINGLPGCEAIYWGSDLESTDPAVLLLVQWRDALTWRGFQQSIAVTFMVPMLRKNPLNRAILCRISDIQGNDKILEMTLFLATSESDEAGLRTDLTRLHFLAAKNGKIDSYIQTVERYASLNHSSSAGKQRAEQQPDMIAGLVVYKETDYYASFKDDALRNIALSLISKASGFCRFTAKLEIVPPDPNLTIASSSSGLKEHSTAGLLSLPYPQRRARFSQSLFSRTRDMGAMNEFAEPAYGQPGPRPWERNERPRQLVVDVFRINIATTSRHEKGIILPDDLAERLDRLQNECEADVACRGVSFGCVGSVREEIVVHNGQRKTGFISGVNENTHAVQLLIGWVATSTALAEKRERARNFVIGNMKDSPYVQEAFLVQDWPSSDLYTVVSDDPADRDRVYELVSFYVSVGDKDIFDKFYFDFLRLERPRYGGCVVGVGAGAPAYSNWPVHDDNGSGGWSEDLVVRNGRQMACFTAIRIWRDPTAVIEWYNAFSGQVEKEAYEKFGMTMDALRLTAAGGVESTFLKLFEPAKVTRWFPQSQPSSS